MIKSQYIKNIFSAIICLGLLSACATFYDFKPATPTTNAYTHPRHINNDFNIDGRFSIKNKEKHDYGNFSWVRVKESEQIDFTSPLGQVYARIVIEGNEKSLTVRDKVYRNDNLNQLMAQQLGFVLPISYLHYWLQGIAIPRQEITAQLPDGFMQLGWRVEYLEWQDANHPKIIMCTNNDLVIKLLINWNGGNN